MQRIKTAIQHQIDSGCLKTNYVCDWVSAGKNICSTCKHSSTSENFKQVITWFTLFVQLQDAIMHQTALRPNAVMLRQSSSTYKGRGTGEGLQQMVYKHRVIAQNIKQQDFNKGSSEKINIKAPFLQMT